MTERVMSTQKLPMVFARLRAIPLTSATSAAKPTAGDTKFCTTRPANWDRWLIVASPA